MEKILVTGSDGRFGKVFKKFKIKKNLFLKIKNNLIFYLKNLLLKILKSINLKYILHLAGLSRPMKIHEKNISKSIDLNIIGTCNLLKKLQNIKLK